jgi:hypothetical protein
MDFSTRKITSHRFNFKSIPLNAKNSKKSQNFYNVITFNLVLIRQIFVNKSSIDMEVETPGHDSVI